MSIPTLKTSPTLRLTPEPLTSASFAPFGTAIIPPLPRDLTHGPPPPASLPQSGTNADTPAPVLANQNSALKYSSISPLDNEYPGRCASGQAAGAKMSMFSCFGRELRAVAAGNDRATAANSMASAEASRGLFDVTILERHPYTTQTFIPLNTTASDTKDDGPLYLVIVAPTLHNKTAPATTLNASTGAPESVTVTNPPDLSNIKAFVACHGQAVTYGAGTWHAPMVVLGDRRVDFVVVQFANGVGYEDCQEVGFGVGVEVVVDGYGEGKGRDSEAKL